MIVLFLPGNREWSYQSWKVERGLPDCPYGQQPTAGRRHLRKRQSDAALQSEPVPPLAKCSSLADSAAR